MKKQLRVFLAGILVVVPFAVTIWVVYTAGAWLGKLGGSMLESVGLMDEPGETWRRWGPWLGAAIILGAIYAVGLMTRFWVFRGLLGLLDRLFERLPGIKVVYQSVRELMKFFGSESQKMGRSVLYRPPGTNVTLLGLLTNDNPREITSEDGRQRVAVYFPFAYMIGGPLVYVPREDLEEIDMPVETAFKLAATAHIGMHAQTLPQEKARRSEERDKA
ncbi:MAG: DUF502 domain-containing protein [Phycisphaerae bacterium]